MTAVAGLARVDPAHTAVRHHRRPGPVRWLAFAAFLLVTVALMLPVIIIVLTAFKPASEVNAYPPTLFPHQWTLDNFAAIFQRLPFGRLIVNSFVFAGGVTLFALIFDSLVRLPKSARS